MGAVTADLRLPASFSSIVAFISDERRAALSHLLAERTSLMSGVLLFAGNADELRRTVTSGSLILIEGSRLGELAAPGRVREAAHVSGARGDRATIADPGAAIEAWLAAMPEATRIALRQALAVPRAWSVKRLAHTAGVSTRQLVRQFHAAGCRVSPKDVLLAARLAAAQALLRDARPVSTTQLAHACGWVDVRSLRAALRRAGFTSVSALAHVAQGHATVSDLAARVGGY